MNNILANRKVVILVLMTMFIAYYISDLLFINANSFEVYLTLKENKVKLEEENKFMQLINERLQKDYFELKNLEPKK